MLLQKARKLTTIKLNTMGKQLETLGLQLGGQAASSAQAGVFGAIFGKGADRRQYQLQEKMQRLGIYGAKEMADYNYEKELQMWKDTNYSAQMAELEKAGLNPGLLYGMGGGGGTTTGSPNTGIPQGSAGRGPSEILGMGMNYAELQLLKAQKENIEADTASKRADVGVKEATVPKLGAETASITQGIENQKAQEALTKVQTEISKVQLNFDKDTQQNRETIVNFTASKLNTEISILEKQNLLDGKTLNTKVAILKSELALNIIESWLKTAQTANVNQDTRLKVEQTKAVWEAKQREWEKLSTERDHNADILNDMRGMNDELPKEIKDLIGGFIIPIGKMK